MKSLFCSFLVLLFLSLPAWTQDRALGGDLVFDVHYYMRKYPDIARFYGGNAGQALQHWLTQGMREGRESSPVFDVKFYLKTYPDVAKLAAGNNQAAVEHWLKVGIPEGRQGSENFDVKVYLETVRGRLPDPTYEKAIRYYLSLPPEKQTAMVKVAPAKPGPIVEPAKDAPVKGKFYVEVDDLAVLYLNSVKIHRANLGASQTGEIDLKPGDHLVVQLQNATAPRYFKLLFVSSDKHQMINFPNTALKILPDPEAVDFAPAPFAASARYARQIKNNRNPFPYKNQSEYMWGEADICTLGALLTREMFVPLKL